MKTYLQLLFAILMLSGCNQNSPEKLVRKHISEIENQIKADSTRGEDFASFFEQFKRDTLFQQERVCLPFVYTVTVDDGTGVYHDSTIVGNDKKEWPFCSFKINDSINYSRQDQNVKHDTVEVILKMDQSSFDSRAIHAEFVIKNGKWINISMNMYTTFWE